MKTMLILTGPQGSGNHMWSKVFALHPWVAGWSSLLNEYWIGHDQEPFADCWANPDLLRSRNWGTHNYYVTSISVPYMHNGTATTPNFRAFVQGCQTAGLQVKFAIVGRDRNVIDMQETRVRGQSTYQQALDQYRNLNNPCFLSYELLHLYREKYLESVSQQLAFPIAYNDTRLNDILIDDTNAKYFKPVKHHPTDDLARHASRRWRD